MFTVLIAPLAHYIQEQHTPLRCIDNVFDCWGKQA